jgi:hypothetical protein
MVFISVSSLELLFVSVQEEAMMTATKTKGAMRLM